MIKLKIKSYHKQKDLPFKIECNLIIIRDQLKNNKQLKLLIKIKKLLMKIKLISQFKDYIQNQDLKVDKVSKIN